MTVYIAWEQEVSQIFPFLLLLFCNFSHENIFLFSI